MVFRCHFLEQEGDSKKVEEGRQIFGVVEGDVLSALNALQAYARTGKVAPLKEILVHFLPVADAAIGHLRL